jgi:hypothetical protein
MSAGGNLGIGTATPTEKLEVNGTYGRVFNRLDTTGTTSVTLTGQSSGITVFEAGSPDVGHIYMGVRGKDNTLNPGFGKVGDSFMYSSIASNGLNILSANGVETDDYIRFYAGRLYVSGSTILTPDIHIQGSGSTRGNVGIGTTDPTQKLHISGNSRVLVLEGSDHVYQEFYPQSMSGGRFGWIGYGSSGTTDFRIWNQPIGGRLLFGTENSLKMTINGDGNVGIGVGAATPTAKLHINNNTTGATFLVEDSSNPDSTPFIIDTSGNVGIGTANPITKLHVSGNTLLSGGLTATSISATTGFYSAGTSLESIIYNIANTSGGSAKIQPGSNITTGGTESEPVINLVSSPSVNNITFSGTAIGGNLSANTLSAATIYSGSTNLYNIFSANDYYTTGSTFNAPTKVATFNRNDGGSYTLNLSALTTVDTYVTGITFSSTTLVLDQNQGQPRLTATMPTASLSGVLSSVTFNIYTTGAISASTFYGSGSGLTGINDYYTTGSTFNAPTKVATFNRNDGGSYTLNLSALTTADTYATGFTYNPSTNVLTIKQNEGQSDLTSTINSFSSITITGLTVNSGTQFNGDINVDGNVLITKNVTILGTATTINTETLSIEDNVITINSNATGNTAPLPINSGIEVLRNSGTTAALTWQETDGYWAAGLTGSTARIILQGDGLNLLNSGHTHPISQIVNLQNSLDTKFDKSGGTISGAVYVNNSLSANTLYSGSTNLYDIFLTATEGNDVTRVQPGTNITTGGTENNPIINLASSPFVNNITFSGTARGTSLSATTISATTFYSGVTNLASLFVNGLSAGSNISLGGTATQPIVNVIASPSFNNLTLSGSASLNTLIVSSTSQLNGAITSGNLSGATDRMVQVSSGGTFSATKQIISAYIVSGGTVANILENESNWDLNGGFIGSGITGTYMGQKHYNYNYFFEAVEDNDWIRLIRG